MNIKYKYGDIEVHYEDVKSATRIEQDKEIMDFVYNKFLDLYNLKKQVDKESVDVTSELFKVYMEKDNG
jgi:hypothetical protein